jgi:hypothetical protein
MQLQNEGLKEQLLFENVICPSLTLLVSRLLLSLPLLMSKSEGLVDDDTTVSMTIISSDTQNKSTRLVNSN